MVNLAVGRGYVGKASGLEDGRNCGGLQVVSNAVNWRSDAAVVARPVDKRMGGAVVDWRSGQAQRTGRRVELWSHSEDWRSGRAQKTGGRAELWWTGGLVPRMSVLLSSPPGPPGSTDSSQLCPGLLAVSYCQSLLVARGIH